MGWARMDDGFHDHPKVDELSLSAVGLWTLCWSWAHRHRKTAIIAGHVTEARVRKVAGKQGDALAADLVRARLWDVEENIGGWVFHDFADYLPKDRDPDERREAGRKGAANRWQPDSNLPSDDVASDSSRASAPASPSRPVPKNEELIQGGQRTETLDPSEARCTAHQGVADPGPCRGCMTAREAAQRAIDRAKLALVDERRDCPLCDEDGFVLDPTDGHPIARCDHQQRRTG